MPRRNARRPSARAGDLLAMSTGTFVSVKLAPSLERRARRSQLLFECDIGRGWTEHYPLCRELRVDELFGSTRTRVDRRNLRDGADFGLPAAAAGQGDGTERVRNESTEVASSRAALCVSAGLPAIAAPWTRSMAATATA